MRTAQARAGHFSAQSATAAKVAATALLAALCAGNWAWGNGGPFVVKHPNGDPAAKGVLARLDPTLKPAQETRLRVLKEDLTIRFLPEQQRPGDKRKLPPVVEVTAAYRIENPTDGEVQEDFGFPILRGIYMRHGMVSYPDMRVVVDKEGVSPTLISNSVIYGIIRQNARKVIEEGIAANPELALLTAAVRGALVTPRPASPPRQPAPSDPFAETNGSGNPGAIGGGLERIVAIGYRQARENLEKHLTGNLHWNDRDATLLVEYASLKFGTEAKFGPRDRWDYWGLWNPNELDRIKLANLGPLVAIGEQKATQLFAQLASRFDKDAGSAYEAIFAAWGGDVRERAIDLETGELRPRELSLSRAPAGRARSDGLSIATDDLRLTGDPTVYARLDYLDPNAKISKEEKPSCQAVLKNLPAVFTFAPMNLLHYQVKFPPHATRTVTVTYRQYAYADTRGSGSYQLAYVLHPATLWKEFGPINVTLQVPKGIACKASAAIQRTPEEPVKPGLAANDAAGPVPVSPPPSREVYRADVYQVTLTERSEKSGELFVGVDQAAWDKAFVANRPEPASPRQKAPRQPAQPAAGQQSAPAVQR